MRFKVGYGETSEEERQEYYRTLARLEERNRERERQQIMKEAARATRRVGKKSKGKYEIYDNIFVDSDKGTIGTVLVGAGILGVIAYLGRK